MKTKEQIQKLCEDEMFVETFKGYYEHFKNASRLRDAIYTLTHNKINTEECEKTLKEINKKTAYFRDCLEDNYGYYTLQGNEIVEKILNLN